MEQSDIHGCPLESLALGTHSCLPPLRHRVRPVAGPLSCFALAAAGGTRSL